MFHRLRPDVQILFIHLKLIRKHGLGDYDNALVLSHQKKVEWDQGKLSAQRIYEKFPTPEQLSLDKTPLPVRDNLIEEKDHRKKHQAKIATARSWFRIGSWLQVS